MTTRAEIVAFLRSGAADATAAGLRTGNVPFTARGVGTQIGDLYAHIASIATYLAYLADECTACDGGRRCNVTVHDGVEVRDYSCLECGSTGLASVAAEVDAMGAELVARPDWIGVNARPLIDSIASVIAHAHDSPTAFTDDTLAAAIAEQLVRDGHVRVPNVGGPPNEPLVQLFHAGDELDVLADLVDAQLAPIEAEPAGTPTRVRAVREWSMLNSLRTQLREALWGLRR